MGIITLLYTICGKRRFVRHDYVKIKTMSNAPVIMEVVILMMIALTDPVIAITA